MLSAHPTLRAKDLPKSLSRNLTSLAHQKTMYYTYNGRGAIYQLLRALSLHKERTVLLPTFHCPTVVDPILRAGYRAVFYRIRADFSIDFDDLSQKLCSDVLAVVAINYCGFPADFDSLRALKGKSRFYLLEDCAHSFLRDAPLGLTGDRGDVAIYSFRKLIPSYAGGALRINADDLTYRALPHRIGMAHTAVVLKRMTEQVVENVEDGLVKTLLQYLERMRVSHKKKSSPSTEHAQGEQQNPYPFLEHLALAKIPWFSYVILQTRDYKSVVSVRRKHYQIFDTHLKEQGGIRKAFSYLPDQVCPWAYPVLLDERSRHEHCLRECGVPIFTFGELLHPLVHTQNRELIADAVYLSNSLLMIPIHQNFREEEIERFCEIINHHFRA